MTIAVRAIIEELPDEMKGKLADVVFLIREEPDPVIRSESGIGADEDLLGFYRGIPLPDRTTDMLPDLPDTIYLFRGPILREAGMAGTQVVHIVRETLLHEIAHFFGYDDDDLVAMDLY